MSAKAQEFLFQRIKELLPPHVTLADAIAEILNLSSDSTYRRIRGETPMVLDEVSELCRHYGISLDQLMDIKSSSTLFQNIRIDLQHYDYKKYLENLLKQLLYIGSFKEKEIIYLTKDIPISHNFYFKPLIAFRYFFWMKTILQDPAFVNRRFEMNCVSQEIEALSYELSKAYNQLPSVEIWNTECINSVISQIEFYKDSGYFSSMKDVKLIYESLEETIIHLKNQVEHGSKYMPDENAGMKKNNFRFFYNRVVLGNNTILAITNETKSCFLNYDVLNYLLTRDESFCNSCFTDLQNLMKRATLISQTGERHRNIFFSILLNKIVDRKKHL